jgi:cell division protein FtsQ
MESTLAGRLRLSPPSLLGELARRTGLARGRRRGPARAVRRARARVRPARRTVAIVALAAAVLSGGFLLFRDSSLVAVQQVQIAGVAGPESAAVSQALESAAKRMSTLDYSAGDLQAAVARYPVVRSLSVIASFPHRMRVVVSEQPPVAQVSAAGVHTAVAADGIVLGQALLSRSLPDIPVSVAPSVGRRVADARVRAYLTVLGAAPYPLLRLVARIYTSDQGVTAQMRGGLLIYFGDAARPHAKWDALVTVLSDPGAKGSSYVDVRVPQRAASGGAQSGSGSGEASGVSASDPTSAALAESLDHAVNGEPTTPLSSTATAPAEPSPATPSAEPSTTEAPAGG